MDGWDLVNVVWIQTGNAAEVVASFVGLEQAKKRGEWFLPPALIFAPSPEWSFSTTIPNTIIISSVNKSPAPLFVSQ